MKTRQSPKVHILTDKDHPYTKPAHCGVVAGTSITEAWGYWGKGGDGHKDVCKVCVRVIDRKTRGFKG